MGDKEKDLVKDSDTGVVKGIEKLPKDGGEFMPP